MMLCQGTKKTVYTVNSVFLDDPKTVSRLEALGIIKNSDIKIVSKRCSGTMVIDVRGVRLAVSREISHGIEVKI